MAGEAVAALPTVSKGIKGLTKFGRGPGLLQRPRPSPAKMKGKKKEKNNKKSNLKKKL